jgi:hypothetical protein
MSEYSPYNASEYRSTVRMVTQGQQMGNESKNGARHAGW